jgi:hypothetical protein
MHYVRAVGIGSTPDAQDARIVLHVPGSSPCMSIKKAGEWLRMGRLDDSGYRQIVESIERLKEMWKRGIGTHLSNVEDRGVWVSLGENRHMKRNYI